jgi:hypothetical protein
MKPHNNDHPTLSIFLVRVVTLIKLFQQMRPYILVHGKHGDSIFSSHDCLELFVTNDFSFVLWILFIERAKECWHKQNLVHINNYNHAIHALTCKPFALM